MTQGQITWMKKHFQNNKPKKNFVIQNSINGYVCHFVEVIDYEENRFYILIVK